MNNDEKDISKEIKKNSDIFLKNISNIFVEIYVALQRNLEKITTFDNIQNLGFLMLYLFIFLL